MGNYQVPRRHIQLRHKAPPRSMIQLNREVISQSAAGLPRRKRLCCGAGTEHNEGSLWGKLGSTTMPSGTPGSGVGAGIAGA